MVSKDSPAAKNRFIYYPDRLNQLPNDAVSAMLSTTLPVMKSVIPGIFMALFKRMGPLEHSDESIGSFFTRLCGPNLSQNVISAVLHGIYAGDVDKLSVKTLFPNLWRAGILDRSVLGSITSPDGYKEYENCLLEYQLASKENGAMQWMFANANVYSFTDGIETLSQALVADLAKKLNITIKTSTPVSMITYKADTYPLRFSVNGEAHSHVISTLYAPVTNALLPQKLQVPELAQIPAVTVLVVNLYFATPNLLPVEGFGYLLPKSLTEDQNPHKALGVIFDSCTTPHPSENGTKLTVMLGGHHWYGRTKYPDDAEAVSMARDVLRQHLKITEDPVATHVTLNRDCIPQYNVGHDQKIKRIKEGLMESFEGRLSVAGASYKGVGLNDCVRSARDVVVGLTERSEGVWTGLEGLGDEKIYVSPEEQLRIREKVLDER